MTTMQYVALMLYWFGDAIANHPGLAEPEYQEAVKVLLPLSSEDRRTIANTPEWEQGVNIMNEYITIREFFSRDGKWFFLRDFQTHKSNFDRYQDTPERKYIIV